MIIDYLESKVVSKSDKGLQSFQYQEALDIHFNDSVEQLGHVRLDHLTHVFWAPNPLVLENTERDEYF
jgi:hypothetical protein